MLDTWIAHARKAGASDVHLEAGLPVGLRVRGALRTVGDPVPGKRLMACARDVVPRELWASFVERRSFDTTRVIAGAQCRINVFQTSRGIGLAVRLLAGVVPTLETLNLHPDLGALAERTHGLVVVAGATGAGKTTTLAALVEHVNRSATPRHVVTIENPIEYRFTPRRAFIRQREVGRDTPSFEQALLDALREDPDVLVVGEMRHRRTMQLTLDAAETGHLVLATMHSSTPAEAVSRIVSAFPSESQAGVRAQLADVLVAVVSQSLAYRADAGERVPECAILTASPAVRANIRDGQLFKLEGIMETGAADGMWTLARYRRWLDTKRPWRRPADARAAATGAPQSPEAEAPLRLPPLQAARPAGAPTQASSEPAGGGVIEIGDDATALEDVIAQLEGR